MPTLPDWAMQVVSLPALDRVVGIPTLPQVVSIPACAQVGGCDAEA
ncbi:MAG TPA: hypothetical protein VMI13_11335 [Solirubrobacteraceae bacterium]|nr:hypothetical protein [Solirubrobacteraceae bacterium]